MLIVSQDGMCVLNIGAAEVIGFEFEIVTEQKFYMKMCLSRYNSEAKDVVSFQAGKFSDKKFYQKCFEKLLDAYANGEKVFRVPKEEELTDDDD